MKNINTLLRKLPNIFYNFLETKKNVSHKIKKRIFHFRYEALWVFWGQIGTAIGGIIGIKILTYALNPIEFGRLALANTIILLIGANFFGPLGQGYMRFWSISLNRGEIDSFISISDRYTNIIISCLVSFSIVFAIFSSFLFDRRWTFLIFLSLVAGILGGWFSIRLAILMAARKRKNVAILNTANALFKPIIAALLIHFFSPNAEWALMGYCITACILLSIVGYYYRKTVLETIQSNFTMIKKNINKVLGKEIYQFSWPFFIWGIFGWVHQSCDRWALQAYHGSDVVGSFFIIAQTAAYPLIFGSGFLSALFIPIAYEKAGSLASNGDVKTANKIIIMMTGLYLLGAAIVITVFLFFHYQIIVLISNIKYVKLSYLLPAVTTAWGFFYFGQMLTGFGFLANRPHLYILPISVSGIIAAISTFSLSAFYGPDGVAWGLGISGFIYSSWCAIIAFNLLNPDRTND